MDARPKTVRDILHTGDQYIIPLFQRYYSWQKEHWDRLRKDIWALMEDESKPVHFLGPLVCTPTSHVPGAIPAYQLIDGQQRLTTLTVLLTAIRDVARSRNLDDLAAEISEDYLLHKRKQGTDRYKVLPRLGDREALMAMLEGQDLERFAESQIHHARKYFERHVEHWTRQDTAERLRQVLHTTTSRLALVVVTIEGENPYEIFESLNSKGLPLEESDLIRNFVFMRIPLAKQEEFFDLHWKRFEDMFDATEDEEKVPMTPFYRDYLMKDGRYSKERATFLDFKERQKASNSTPEQQVQELLHFASLDLMLWRPRSVKREELSRLLGQVEGMDIATSYPLLLNLLDMNKRNQLSNQELDGCILDLVSFVLRRSICGETTRQFNRWFVEAIAVLGDSPRQNLQKYWLNRRWPDDTALAERFVDFPIYRREGQKARVILEAIEDSRGHKEKVDLNRLSIEHVMPQTIGNNAAGKSWKAMLGDKWDQIHEKYLHCLGNLTLTGYNPDLSNASFERKQDLLKDSHVELNRYFDRLPAWTDESIRKRTKELAAVIAQLWPRPTSEIPYLASAEALPEPEGLSAREKRRLEYWRHLDVRLEERGFPPDAIVPKPETVVVLPLGKTKSADVGLGFDQQNGLVYVSLGLFGEVGEAIEQRMNKEKEQIEKELGYPLEWEPGDIFVADDNVPIWDQDDWPVQHDWLGDRLEDYLRVFKARVEKAEEEVISDPDLRRKIEKRERMIAYWNACAAELANTPIRFRDNEVNAGRSYCRFEHIDTGISFGVQYYDSDAGWLCVYFGVSKKAGRRLRSMFKELAESHRGELEALMGEELEWLDPYLSIYKEANIEEKEDWPRQHKWLREKGEKLLGEFTIRLNLE